MTKQLYRSTTNQMIAGVCGGLAEFFDVDATLFRVLFVAVTMLGGAGILVYIILWIVMPLPSSTTHDPKVRLNEFKQEAQGFVQHTAEQLKQGMSEGQRGKVSRTQRLFAFALILIGAIIILRNVLPHISYSYVWPVILVVFGVWLLWQGQPLVKDLQDETHQTTQKEDSHSEHGSDKKNDRAE